MLRPLFWDQDFIDLDWEGDRDFIVRRILQSGDWSAICWLRASWGDEALRLWLLAHSSSQLNPRQLRFWELILDLPGQDVDRWIAQVKNSPWESRVQP